jgi:hypothetical protein
MKYARWHDWSHSEVADFYNAQVGSVVSPEFGRSIHQKETWGQSTKNALCCACGVSPIQANVQVDESR